jgi:hypothetical protein
LPNIRNVGHGNHLQAHVPWRGKLRVLGNYRDPATAALARDLAWIALRGHGFVMTQLNLPEHEQVRLAISELDHAAPATDTGTSAGASGARAATRVQPHGVTWASIKAKVQPWQDDLAPAPRAMRGVSYRAGREPDPWEVCLFEKTDELLVPGATLAYRYEISLTAILVFAWLQAHLRIAQKNEHVGFFGTQLDAAVSRDLRYINVAKPPLLRCLNVPDHPRVVEALRGRDLRTSDASDTDDEASID